MKPTWILQLIIPTLMELEKIEGISDISYNPTRTDVKNPWQIYFKIDSQQEIAFNDEIKDNCFKEKITRALTILEMCNELLYKEGFTLNYNWPNDDDEKEISIHCSVKEVFDKIPGEIDYGIVYETDPESRLKAWQIQVKFYFGIGVNFFAQGSNIVRTQ